MGKGHISFCSKCPAHETNDAIIMAWPLTLLLFTCVGTYAVLGLWSFSSLHLYAHNSFFSLRRQTNIQKEAAHGASLLLVSQFFHHMTKILNVASFQTKNVAGWDVGKGHKSFCAKCPAHMTENAANTTSPQTLYDTAVDIQRSAPIEAPASLGWLMPRVYTRNRSSFFA